MTTHPTSRTTPDPTLQSVGNGTCGHCGGNLDGRKGRRFCSDSCRYQAWREAKDAKLRAEIISRHMASLNAELRAHGLDPFGGNDASANS